MIVKTIYCKFLPVFQHLEPFNLTTVCFCSVWSHRSVVHSEDWTEPTTLLKERPDHNTGKSMPYSLRIECGFFYVPQNCKHSSVMNRGLQFIVLIREDLKVLTICRCNHKGSTFSSVPLSVGPARVKLTSSHKANRCSTNWATAPLGLSCSKMFILVCDSVIMDKQWRSTLVFHLLTTCDLSNPGSSHSMLQQTSTSWSLKHLYQYNAKPKREVHRWIYTFEDIIQGRWLSCQKCNWRPRILEDVVKVMLFMLC